MLLSMVILNPTKTLLFPTTSTLILAVTMKIKNRLKKVLLSPSHPNFSLNHNVTLKSAKIVCQNKCNNFP